MEPRDIAVKLLGDYQFPRDFDDPHDPTIYATIADGKGPKSFTHAMCYARLNRKAFQYLAIPHYHVADMDWYHKSTGFLLDPERSPWKAVLPFVELHEKGLILSGEAPANLAFNFLIAHRVVTFEFPTTVHLWRNLVEAGRDPYISMVYANGIQWMSQAALHPNPFPSNFNWPGGHGCFNPYADIERFLRGEPKNLSGSILSGASYRPCNTIWDGDEDHRQKLIERYPDICIKNMGWTPDFTVQSEAMLHDLVAREEEFFASRIHH